MVKGFLLLILTLTTSNGQKLDKPTLLKGFNDLDSGLKDNLPKQTPDLVNIWSPGWILEDCKTIAEKENFSPSDIETFNVQYADCSSPWVCPFNALNTAKTFLTART